MKKIISKTARNVETVHTHTHTHTGNLYIKGRINKNITIFLLFIIFIILNTGNTKAVLQANGNTSAVYNLSDWMLNVRKMEELGGAMGLQETVNSDLTSSESNNIDVHMEKNTEYGALVILSASSYGNPNVIVDGQTTTGNATGVIMNINSEWVAAATSSVGATNFNVAVSRYKNIYTRTTYVEKIGDAILSWHGASENTWINRDTSGLIRSYSGSVFSYNGYGGSSGTNEKSSTASYPRAYATRAVVVSGQGL